MTADRNLLAATVIHISQATRDGHLWFSAQVGGQPIMADTLNRGIAEKLARDAFANASGRAELRTWDGDTAEEQTIARKG